VPKQFYHRLRSMLLHCAPPACAGCFKTLMLMSTTCRAAPPVLVGAVLLVVCVWGGGLLNPAEAGALTIRPMLFLHSSSFVFACVFSGFLCCHPFTLLITKAFL